ncbi:MAG TPA: YfhO family protein, partial [Myxococcaceae bacterium]|nr:YfhO family protein [Myxococcaceae bacterium]
PKPDRIDGVLRDAPRSVYDFAGVTYFVRRAPPFGDVEEVAAPEGLPKLYRSKSAMPRAFVLHRAKRVGDAEALAAVRDPSEPFRHTVFLSEGEPLEGAECQSPEVRFIEDGAHRVHLGLEACAEGYLVLTDAYYPGWRAELDGAPVPILRADHLVRAIRVAAGKHEVVMRYRPATFAWGGGVSLVALAALAWGLWPRRRKAGRRPAPSSTPAR